MNLPRRRFLRIAAGAAALPTLPRIAKAQAYPTRPVRIIVGFAAGSATDTLARILGQWLSEQLGQPFIIEDKPGAGTSIAVEAVVRAPADGYTIGVIGSANAINVTLYQKLAFNFIRDVTPVAGFTRNPLVMVVNPSIPPTTIPAFITYAKANPGKINMASFGTGTISHLAGELFKLMAGVNMIHVPYRGAPPAITDLLGGQVQVYFDAVPSAIEHIKAGRLRALAVATATRLEALPDVPTIGEFVPGYEVSGWQGFGAPKNTPPEIIERLNRQINACLADPKIKARIADLGTSAFPASPTELAKLMVEETEKWAKVIKFAGIKPG